MNNYTFQFHKLWYPTKELLEIIPIPRSTFFIMQEELTKKGRDLSEMGRIKVQGLKSVLWDPIKFKEFLEAEKINQPIKYNLDTTQTTDPVKVAVGVFHQQQKEKEILI